MNLTDTQTAEAVMDDIDDIASDSDDEITRILKTKTLKILKDLPKILLAFHSSL